MEKSSQIAWKIVLLRHFFPLKVVPLIEVLLCIIFNFHKIHDIPHIKGVFHTLRCHGEVRSTLFRILLNYNYYNLSFTFTITVVITVHCYYFNFIYNIITINLIFI
jgi:hypothetical protein